MALDVLVAKNPGLQASHFLRKLLQLSPTFPSSAPGRRLTPAENTDEMAVTRWYVRLLELKGQSTVAQLTSTTDLCFAYLEAVVLGTRWWQTWLLPQSL